MVKWVLLNIIIWFSVGLSIAQNPFVELEVNPKTIERGQTISITIKTNVDGQMDMNLPNGFIQSGPMQSGMSSSIAYVDGRQRATRYSYQAFTGYFEEPGTYTIGPVIIKDKNGEIESNPQSVRVIERQNMISEYPSKNLNQMIFGIIEQSEKELYEGEPLILEGKVYSQVEILQVEGFNSFNFDGPSDNHLIANPNHVNSSYDVINGKNIQTFRIGKTLIFPEKVGSFKIKPFKTIILYNDPRTHYPERIKIISNETKVNIKPLPEGMPKYFIGAVGDFDISADFLNTDIQQGKVVELKVRVEGYGNLHNIDKPKIHLPSGLAFYGDAEVIDSINYTTRGSEGSKSFTYFIQVNKSGNIQIDPIKVSFFNPTKEVYETISCKVQPLLVKPNGEEIEEFVEPEIEEVKTPTLQPYITEKIGIDHSDDSLYNGWKGAALIFSPIMLGLVLGLGVRIKKESNESSNVKKLRVQHKVDALAELNKLKEEQNNLDKLDKLFRLLIYFLAREFKVDNGEISRLFLKSKVPNGISERVYQQLIYVFDELDSMKYGGSVENADVSHLKDEVENIINSFKI